MPCCAEARAAVSATLPLLLEVGLPSNVAEVSQHTEQMVPDLLCMAA